MTTIYQLRRATPVPCPPCHGRCQQGWHCNAASCAPEGGKHADPVPSATTRRDVTGARIGAVLLLVSATTVIGVIGAAVVTR